MSRKSCLILLEILLTPVLILFVGVLLYWYIPRSKVYYIPQKQVYMKITETASPYLDIVLGSSSKLQNSKEYDSFKLNKNSINDFVIDCDENILYFEYYDWERYDDNGRKYMDTIKSYYHLNSVRFKMIEVSSGDTLLYDGKDRSGYLKLKKEYMNVVIKGKNSVSLKVSGDSVYTSLTPIF